MGTAGRVIYRARYLLPMVAPCLEDGALLVEDGRIVAVDRAACLLDGEGAEVVDFGAAVLLPPMANAHTHLELTHLPYWDPYAARRPIPSFTDWLLQLVGVLRGVPTEEFGYSLSDGIRQLLRSGTGAVGDILSRVSARTSHGAGPLRGRLFLEGLGTDPERNRRTLEILRTILSEPAPGPLRYGLAPHSLYTLSTEFLQQISCLAGEHGLAQSIHVAESPEESALLRDGSGDFATRFYPGVGWGDRVPPGRGTTPVDWLTRLQLLRPGDLLVHGVQVSPADIAAIAAGGLYVVLCPRSNARLGVGTAPVAAYRAAGVPLVLGTDSLASCDSLSLWDEVAFARQTFGEVLPPAELLAMATLRGARALGLEGEMGALAPGYGAHFQVLQPKLLPECDTLEAFLCRPGRSGEVRALYLDGKPCNP